MLHYGVNKSNETLETAAGTTDVVHLRAQQPEHLETWRIALAPDPEALCELASMVTTPYFVFTDSNHLIASPCHVLGTASGQWMKMTNEFSYTVVIYT